MVIQGHPEHPEHLEAQALAELRVSTAHLALLAQQDHPARLV
jgi:hypothetical protein